MRRIWAMTLIAACLGGAAWADDPYADYIRTAPEFQPVRQDRALLLGRWDTWLYMPWRFQWTIGTGDEGGRFARDYGLNGGFVDHGEGPFDWLEKWGLRFYNDHTAGKGFLYLRDANRQAAFKKYQRDPRAVRAGSDGPQPLDKAALTRLEALIRKRVENVRRSPMRVAYALDDEISWGAFLMPLPWRLNDDDAAYAAWLKRYYGPGAPRPQFVTPDFVLEQLARPVARLDFAPLLDRVTYNDSLWADFLGRLVSCANAADPDTPCGFVGAQSPNMWGGFDYAKLCKKIQFVEAYDLGSAQAVVRSLAPAGLPQVTTHFHKDKLGVANDIWQSWYFFAHGNRGMIGWVEGWFDGQKPKPWLDQYRATLRELGAVQGPKLVGARWLHDGVAVYYSHPSIQVAWCLDAQAHGKTWINRGNDYRLGTSHNVRKAWEHLLTDSGLQYNFVGYDQVVRDGVPAEYKVLILPACYALSDVEARRIENFCRGGGTVVADFACGLFDQHGQGRSRGALDGLFGVAHDGRQTSRDFFSGKLWVETDQDKAYSFQHYRELFATLPCKLHDGFAVAEPRLPVATVRKVGRGTAVYLNLSPQRYLQYRAEGATTDAQRQAFVRYVVDGGARPWLQVASAGARPRNAEAVYWSKDGRTTVLVVQKAALGGSSLGGGGSQGLIAETVSLDVRLSAEVADVRDERSGRSLGRGRAFSFPFNTLEAVMFSFQGDPPR